MNHRPSTRRRTAAVGTIGAAALLLATAACSSDPADTSADSVQTTVGDAGTLDTTAPTVATPSTGAPADTTPTSSPRSEPAPTEPAVVVPEALQFTAPLVGGGTFDGAAVAGKPTVFWFWAPT